MKHELTRFIECTFGDDGHYYHKGYDRALCSCGWKSACSRNHNALVALFDGHVRNVKADKDSPEGER